MGRQSRIALACGRSSACKCAKSLASGVSPHDNSRAKFAEFTHSSQEAAPQQIVGELVSSKEAQSQVLSVTGVSSDSIVSLLSAG